MDDLSAWKASVMKLLADRIDSLVNVSLDRPAVEVTQPEDGPVRRFRPGPRMRLVLDFDVSDVTEPEALAAS